MLVLTRNDNSWLQLTLSIWKDMAVQAHCENTRIFEMLTDQNRKDLFEATPRLVLEINITKHIDRHGIEIKIDSMQKDGSQFWIVNSRCIDKYVTELLEENRLCEEASSSTGKLIAMEPREPLIPSSSSSTTLPTKQ